MPEWGMAYLSIWLTITPIRSAGRLSEGRSGAGEQKKSADKSAARASRRPAQKATLLSTLFDLFEGLVQRIYYI